MSADVLPGSAGPFTRAITYSWDTSRRYAPWIGSVQTLGLTVEAPEDWVPWLIYDLGLEDVIPYVRDFRRVLAEGPLWQARRGTPAGISIGIGWVDSEGVVAAPDGRHNWWEFQVAFTQPVEDLAQLRQLYGIINLSKAAEDELFRMYSPEYDHRPVRMDQQRFDEGGWMDDYSGAPRWEDGPYISFGRDEVVIVDVDPLGTGMTVLETTSLVDWFDSMRLDVSRFGEAPSRLWLTADELDQTKLLTNFEDTWGDRYPQGSDTWRMNGEPQVFVAESSRDDATILTTYTDDHWPDAYPRGTWRGAVGSQPVPINAETS